MQRENISEGEMQEASQSGGPGGSFSLRKHLMYM